MLSCGVSMVYSFFQTARKREQMAGKKLEEIAIWNLNNDKYNDFITKPYLILELCVTDENNNDDIETPNIYYYYKYD